MPCKVYDSLDNSIHPKCLQDGEIAEVILWSNKDLDPVGKIVQRFEDKLIVLGELSDNSYTSVCHCNNNDKVRVRILRPGERIVIT